MLQFDIKPNEAGQRFDKYLHKLLPGAPSSFFYKMLRKKNIVLNGKKAEGKEKLSEGDKVSLFLSEETFQKFQKEEHRAQKEQEALRAYKELKGIEVIYENPHMLLASKPAGLLAQKAKDTDISLNEWLIGYLLNKGKMRAETLSTYRPSVCNRLDRNTSGLVICAKSLYGSQELSRLMKEGAIRKFYRLFVKGRIAEEGKIEGYLTKDTLTNIVSISKEPLPDASYIQTRYYPIQSTQKLTYLEAELITGKTHQIRAHMASIGHPVLMDDKYGDKAFNAEYQISFSAEGGGELAQTSPSLFAANDRELAQASPSLFTASSGKFTRQKLKTGRQLLHAYRLEFPENEPVLMGDKPVFIAPEPKIFKKLRAQTEDFR